MAALDDKQFRIVCVASVCCVAFIAYANTFTNGFVWDDASSILLHKHVQDPRMAYKLFQEDQHAFGRGEGNFYRPLVSLSYMLDFALSRKGPSLTEIPNVSPFLFHVGNLLWHTLAALAFWALLARLAAPRFVQIAAPALWAVHPLHTEAVAYISGRGDPMAAAFMFAGLNAVLLDWQRRWLGVALCAASFVAALLSKESALIFPVLVLMLAAFHRALPRGKDGLPLVAAAVSVGILIAYVILRQTVLRFAAPAEAAALGIGTRLVQAMQSLAVYVKLVFLPANLHMERTLDGVPLWAAIIGLIILVLIVAGMIGAARARQYRLGIALAVFLITWLPISGIFPLNAPLAEHWMYVPLTGLLWALAELLWLACASPSLRPAAYALAYAGCVVFIVMTIGRNRDWRSNESIYLATLEDNDRSIRVHYNLGVTYEDILNNPIGARRAFERVISLYQERKSADPSEDAQRRFWPDELESHLSLGKIYLAQKDIAKAGGHFDTVLRVEVNESNELVVRDAYMGMAQCLWESGRPADARALLEQGAARIPDFKPEFDAIAAQIPLPGS